MKPDWSRLTDAERKRVFMSRSYETVDVVDLLHGLSEAQIVALYHERARVESEDLACFSRAYGLPAQNV